MLRRAFINSVSMAFGVQASGKITVRADFEGGNVEAEAEHQRLRVRPGLGPRDQRRIWFYFEASGYAPRKYLTMEVASREFPVPPDGRIVAWLHPEIVIQEANGEFRTVRGEANADRTFRTYRFRPQGERVRVSLGYPYVYSDVRKLVKALQAESACQVDFPWTSEGGRPIPRVQVGGNDPKKPFVLIIGRQHAFEVGGSFFIEGLLQAAVRSRSPAVRAFREKRRLVVAPMMDVDNAAAGGTGRLQAPVDFNRSWLEHPHWKAVAGVQAWFEEVRREQRALGFIDVHTPFPVEPRGHYYLPSSNSDPGVLAEIYDRYCRSARIQVMAAENADNGDDGKASKWFARRAGERAAGGLLFALTHEVCWHPGDGKRLYTPDEFRKLGAHYLDALAATLNRH